MGIAVLGPLVIDDETRSLSPRDRVVLEALVVCAPRTVSAEQLADALRRDEVPASWRKVVPGCVNRLRRRLGADAIETVGHGYRLAVGADEIDVRRFERLVARGHQLLSLGEPERAAYAFREGLALWRGPALSDLDEWAPGRVESARLKELQLEAEEAVLDASLRMGLHTEVVAEAMARTKEMPLRERRWGLLALAHYLCGSQAEALACLRRARRLLADELGLDPSHELVALEQAILRQDESLTPASALPASSPTCPYPGLLPYGVEDVDTFFGRDDDVDACLGRLAEQGVLVIVGPSGCGKSSLLRAGLVASLEREEQSVRLVAPGEDAGGDLTDAIPELAHGETLIVDQLEELVAAAGDPASKERFLTSLVGAAERGPLAVAVRADRFGDLASHPGFARLAERGLLVINPLSEEALRSVVEGPARSASLLLEPGLVELVVSDVRDEPGGLPLLSHALRQTWERRDGRTLTVYGYRATGGIRGAVARSAEQVYEELPLDRRAALRDLMLRLVSLEADGEPVRARVPRDSLPDIDGHDHLIEDLVRARLLTADADVLALAHEALARAWPRLRGWLEEDHEGQRILCHLSIAAGTWLAMGRPESELYRGERLARALHWEQQRRPDLSKAEGEFLQSSRDLASADERHAREEARGRRRAKLRLTAGAGFVVVLLVLAVVLQNRAARQSERADAASLEGSARRAAVLALDAQEVDRALLLAVEAVSRDDSPETRAALVRALSRAPALIRSVRGETHEDSLSVSPDGRLFAMGGWDQPPTLREARTLEPVDTIPAGPYAHLVAFTPDSSRLVTGNRDGEVSIVDLNTRDVQRLGLGEAQSEGRQVLDLALSADGRRVAGILEDYSGRAGTALLVWTMNRPGRPIFMRSAEAAWGVELDASGRRLYVATRDAALLTVYDVRTGRAVRTLPPGELPFLSHDPGVNSPSDLDLSPDGKLVAIADGDEIALMDSGTLAEVGRLRGHSDRIQVLEFSRDGTLLASGSDDRTVVVWDVDARTPHLRLEAHTGPVRGLGFSPDDQTLYSTSFDHSVLQWDLGGARRFLPLVTDATGQGPFPDLGVLAPDGMAVAFFSITPDGTEGSGTLQLLDVTTAHSKPIRSTYSNWGSFEPTDGEILATAGGNRVRLWRWRTGQLLAEREVTDSAIEAVAYTPDGRNLVVAEWSGTVSVVDAESLAPLWHTVNLGQQIRDIVVAPDGHTAVALMQSGTHEIVDLDSRGATSSRLSADANYAAISPDSQALAVVSPDGQVGLLDLRKDRWLSSPRSAHHTFGIRASYAPDGSTFATSDFGGEVGLWDGHTGDLLALTRPGSPGNPATVQFLEDSHTLVIATTAGDVYHWDTRVEQWIKFACQVAGRNLSPDEWTEAFGSEPFHRTCPEQPES